MEEVKETVEEEGESGATAAEEKRGDEEVWQFAADIDDAATKADEAAESVDAEAQAMQEAAGDAAEKA